METATEAPLMPIVVRPKLVMVRGAGSYLWDSTGKRYLDFIQGWAVNALGHAPPELIQAISQQASVLITPSPALHNGPQLRLARQLVDHSGLAQVCFSNSGAEANEAAVKLARKWGRLHRGGAYEILTTHNAFHGRTLAMMAASGKPEWETLFSPHLPGFRKVPFGDVEAMRRAISVTTVALMVEPIQGEGGVVLPPPGYLTELRRLADEHDLLLILDEIQTGMGRTGRLFAYQHEGVLPDILTLGKGLGGGVPISATLANPRASCFEPGDQGGTYGGNPLATAAALAVLDTVSTPEFLATVRKRGALLRAGLEVLRQRYDLLEVRGKGLLAGLRLRDRSAPRVRDRCLDLGLIVNAPRPDLLRFMPSLRVTEAEIGELLAVLGRVLADSPRERAVPVPA